MSRYPALLLGMVVLVMCPERAHPRMVSAVVDIPRALSWRAMCSAPCRGSGCLAMILGCGGLHLLSMIRVWFWSSSWRSVAHGSSLAACAWKASRVQSRGAVVSVSRMRTPMSARALKATSRSRCSWSM